MPAITNVTIDAAGHWLRADAAASYQRMIAAGMPTGGIASAGRTRAQQAALYDAYLHHRGNLAAKPGTSRHETGLALDITRGTRAQIWATHGGDPWKVTPTGRIRANDYGWSRSVPSEPWHFSYDASRDKHLHDAATPPVVVTPKPLPVPTLARVATLNCYGWNVPKAAWTARARASLLAEIVRLDCSIYSLTECPEYMRDAIRDALPGGTERWRVVVRGTGFHQAILFDNRKWTFGSSLPVEFGPTPYHGGVWATFTQTTTKATVAVGAYHLPPNVVSSDGIQERYLRGFLTKAPKATAQIAGGDGADESSWAVGWKDARLIAAASPNGAAGTYGKAIRDRIFMLGANVRRYTVGPVIVGTDHRSVLAQITIPATITTT